MLHYFLAATATRDVVLPVNPVLGRPEHSEYRWADLNHALQLTTQRLHPVIHWAARLLDA